MGLALYFIVLAVFLVLIVRFRRSAFIFALAIVGWIGALAWNSWILQSCHDECNIRVDLVLIAPLVLVATGFALVEAVRRGRR
jgi:hypothetical protein